jgi:Tfp pilus assembly protein PilF/thiol-disulfide isomerase/thioredoxin
MQAPEISGIDMRTGAEVSTRDWLDNNLVVVLFWATWSERSVDELRDLKSFYIEHPDLALEIVAVNVEGQQLTSVEQNHIAEFVAELNLPFPTILDIELKQFYEYGVIAVPSTAIIDSAGVLRYGPSGYSLTTHDLIVDSIEVLLGLKEPTAEIQVSPGYQPTKQAGRYCQLALNQIGRDQFRRALDNLRKAQAADTGFSQPHILMGEAYIALDSLPQARQSFARAIDLDSGTVTAWTGLGFAFMIDSQFDSAFSYLAKAAAIDNTYTPAMLSLGLCLAERGEVKAAIDSVAQALDLNPRDPAVHYYLGQLHMKAGERALAVKSYRRALELIFPAP